MVTEMDNRRDDLEKSENADAQAYLDHLLTRGAEEVILSKKMDMPEWYDERLFLIGQSTIHKYRFLITSGMLMGLIAVLSIPSILCVLMFSRQSSTPATAYRRYLRTIFHTHAWYNYPPSHPRFWSSIRAVQKAHVTSSHYAQKCQAGKISQKDMALTQFGFIGFFTVGAYRVQLFDDEFLEATSHMWRVLGHLMGIKDEYNICGRSWAETKPRLEIVLDKVYKPSLTNTSKDFEEMTRVLLDGLWTVNTTLSLKSYLYFTKRLANVPGYQYYDFDYPPGVKPDPTQKNYYYDLGWYDRFIVSYGLYIVTYLHKVAWVRWYLNFRVWLGDMFMYYFPYIAFWRFGFRWAYVRIFNKDSKAIDFDYHFKQE